MEQHYRLAALVHSRLVADTVYRETVNMGWSIHIEVTSYETALDDARRLLEQGYEAILCHGGFREAVFAAFGRCTIFIERSDIDLVKSLYKAKAISDEVALTAHDNEARDIDFMEKILGMRIIPVRYGNSDELERKMKKLFADGVHVFVGGGGSARIVSRLGGQIVLDEPQPVNIRNAVARALVIAENVRMERAHLASIQSLMHNIKEGVLCLNAGKEIVFCNSKALKLLRVSHEKRLHAAHFKALFLDDVLENATAHMDAVVTINGERFVINAFPLADSSGGNSAVCFIEDVASLQKISRKINADLYSRGLTAIYAIDDILGNTPPMVKLKENIARYAQTDMPVYIHGETGAGKELVAHALHSASKRKPEPFVVVNCAALPDPLLESELFGYEEGAFTGARRGGKAGLFELANGGTIFFDEIGDMSHAVQLRLLRVLDAKEVMHVGGDRFIPVNVRVVCASHKRLLQLVEEGAFRMDLYYRIAGLCLEIVPLRERLEDIPLLISGLLRRYGKPLSCLTPDIRKTMNEYAWPGNVRELAAVMEGYLVLLGDRAASADRFDEIFQNRNLYPASQEGCAATLRDHMAGHRLRVVREELAKHMGDRQKTADALDISYSSLRRIINAR